MTQQAKMTKAEEVLARRAAAAQSPPAPKHPAPQDAPAVTAPKIAATRKDTKIFSGYLPQGMHQELRLIGLQEGMSNQEILMEALNDWLLKKGLTRQSRT